jgi:DNA adenine methylase
MTLKANKEIFFKEGPTKPVLKWVGGKRIITPILVSLFPSDWNKGTYFEPFLGGGAVFFAIRPINSVISDVNLKLISFYKTLQRDPNSLLEAIRQIQVEFDSLSNENKKDFYLALRNEFNSSSTEPIRLSALFFAMNKLCFNGLYRENSRGVFNVPFGNKVKFPHVDSNQFQEVSICLNGVKILHSDFDLAIKTAKAGDFVYFDPPYIPLSETSNFTAYNNDGFKVESQVKLAELLNELHEKGIRAMVSNSDTPLTRKIYSDFYLEQISAPRMVSAKGNARGHVNELVIRNYK